MIVIAPDIVVNGSLYIIIHVCNWSSIIVNELLGVLSGASPTSFSL